MNKMIKIFIAVFIFSLSPALSQALPLHEVEEYLNDITTFEAEFEQVTPGQDYARGHFYMKRPRQFLWQYEAPLLQKIVSTGSRLYFHDLQTEQTTQLPLNTGLGALFVQDEIDLSSPDLVVKNYRVGDDWVELELMMKEADNAMEEGSLSLVFQKRPLQLMKIVTKDAFGGAIHVLFKDIQEGHKIAANKFDFTPELEKWD